MNVMMEFAIFYKVQILAGMLTGGMLSAMGVFVLLKRITFFGVTLSQAASVSVIVALIMGIRGEVFILALTSAIMLPFHFLTQKENRNSEAILSGGFVFFTASGHALTALGGNVSNHLTRAYFGDVLTVSQEEWNHFILPGIAFVPLFLFFFPYFKAVSFDRDETIVAGLHAKSIEFIFFLLLTGILGISIRLFGSFFSLAHLIFPGLLALRFSKSVTGAIIGGLFFSLISTVCGFFLSFLEIPIGDEILHFPTSSIIILILGILSLAGYLIKKRWYGQAL